MINTSLILILIGLISMNSVSHAESTKIKSVKSLTHMLSKIEKAHGKSARFTTMRLQIYLEDVYISQGTTLFIKHQALSQSLSSAIEQGMNRAQISKHILRQYQKSQFNE